MNDSKAKKLKFNTEMYKWGRSSKLVRPLYVYYFCEYSRYYKPYTTISYTISW